MAHPFNKIRQNNVARKRVGELTSAYSKGTDLLSDESPIARVRADRPMRAAGGRVGKKATTIVNVITQPSQPQPPAPPVMPPPGPPPGGPPMAGPPPMPPGGPAPGGMGSPPMRAKGGRVNKGTKVFEEGKREGTQVSHVPAKDVDIKNMNRPRVVTFNTGGGVVSFKAKGGRINAPATGGMGPKLPGGAGGGEGRLKKAHMTKHGSQV